MTDTLQQSSKPKPFQKSNSAISLSINLKTGIVSSDNISQASRSQRKSSTTSVMSNREEILLAKHAEYQAKLNQRVLEKNAEELSHLKSAPLINPKSRKLAEKIKNKQVNELEKIYKENQPKAFVPAGTCQIPIESLIKSMKARPHSVTDFKTDIKESKEDLSNLSVMDRTQL